MSDPKPAAPSPMQQPATWDSVASGYAAEVSRHTAYAQEALQAAALGANARVLDVGTGAGVFAFTAAPHVASVTAIDFSPGMIAELRARAAREGVTNIDAAVMDAQSLAFPDGSFDAAFSLFAFMFIPDRARAFRELRRVLRDGGRAVVLTWGPIERRPLMKIGFDALAEALPELPPPQKGDLQSPEECVAEMSAAGFRDVSSRPFTASVHVDSAADYLRIMERTAAPLAALRKRLGEEQWAALSARLTQIIGRSIPDSGADVSAEAMVTVGTR